MCDKYFIFTVFSLLAQHCNCVVKYSFHVDLSCLASTCSLGKNDLPLILLFPNHMYFRKCTNGKPSLFFLTLFKAVVWLPFVISIT